jgi:hypothetical protein
MPGPGFMKSWNDPLFHFVKLYRGERAEGKGADLYFESQSEMLVSLRDKPNYTPMLWNKNKEMYTVDFDSTDILGI